MGTISAVCALSDALFAKARRAVLGLLYTHPDETYYVREIVRHAGAGQGGVQRELARLAAAGILRRSVRGRQVYYQANADCPIYPELRAILVKTAGVADVLRAALAPLTGRIRVAFLHGSVARGKERPGSDIDVLLVGDVRFSEAVAALSPAQEPLGREVNPVVYPPAEFRSKLAAGHHFLKTALKESKIFLVGDSHELERLAEKRLAR